MNTTFKLTLLAASLATFTCLTPATALAGQTIWKLGADDDLDATASQASDEFTFQQGQNYVDTVTYDIDTSGSATTNVALPRYLDDDPNCSDCAEKIKIVFDVPEGGYANHAVKLVYARYGSETDVIRVDGDYLARVAVEEGRGAEFRVSLPALTEGQHHITIKYAGKRAGTGTGNGHHIDYIKLVEPDAASGAGWTDLWKIGTRDGPNVTPMQGGSEFGYTSNNWVDGINYDVDMDTEADFPAALSNESTQYSDQPGAVDIGFDLVEAHARGELLITYARYGSEVDLVMIDSDVLGEIGASEGQWVIARFVPPALAAEPHNLSLTILDGLGVTGSHFIDMLELSSAL